MIYHSVGVQYNMSSYKDDTELNGIISKYLEIATSEILSVHACVTNAIHLLPMDSRIGYAEGYFGTEFSRYKLHAWNTWGSDFAFDLTSEVLINTSIPFVVTEWARGSGFYHVMKATRSGTRLALTTHLHRIKSPLETEWSLFEDEELEVIRQRILSGGRCIE
jgi:hypothetical protein